MVNPVHQIICQLSGSVGLYVHQDCLSTILSELFNNALEHGLLELDSSIKETDDGFLRYYQLRRERLERLEDGFINIDIQLIKLDNQSVIEIEVKDSGKGICDEADASPSIDHAFGRGIDIVRKLCDSIEYSHGGSSVTVRYLLKKRV
jgi:anti-sigma regulatory factor (Ser/Thr protein kinase)